MVAADRAFAAAPVAQFTWSPEHPAPGQVVQFTDLSTNAPTSWSWSFGDGASGQTRDPAHVFSHPGSYRVKLTSSNASGHSLGEHTVTVGRSPRTPVALDGRPVAPLQYVDSVYGCDFYASPSGGGNGGSPRSPFHIADFWPIASPGKTLCLLDGVYDDPSGMIKPPVGVSGVEGSPITVRSLYDGGPLIAGGAVRSPILLNGNDWMVLEGMDACCSIGTVVGLYNSSHNAIRRVAAWDAADGNYNIFGVHYGEHNLLEDVAGWGVARKTFESSQDGNFTTIRRGWGRWEGSHVVGPKMVYTLAYNNYDMTVENSIGTWSGEKMKSSYVLLDYSGQPWTGSGAGTYTNFEVNAPYGIFSNDGLTGDKNARARLFGSIAYVADTDVFKADRQVFVTNIDSVEIKDTLAVFAPGSNGSGKYTFGLYGLTTSTDNGGETNVLAADLTSLKAGSRGIQIGDGWQQADIYQTPDSVGLAASTSRFPGEEGADLCHRYVDGSLTDRTLWPWPMNSRIREATARSGRAPIDLTATIEKLLGAIPSACRSIGWQLPAVEHLTAGAGEPAWITDLQVHNPSDQTSHAALLFRPIDMDRVYRVELQVAPAQTLQVLDTVRNMLGIDTAIGSIEVRTDTRGEEALRVRAGILSSRGPGTVGLSEPSVPDSKAPLSSPIFVPDLAETSAFHSTLGALNASGGTQTFKIVLWTQSGSILSVSPLILLEPGAPARWPVAELFARASGAGLVAEFRPEDGSTVPISYGIVEDKISGDATYHSAAAPSSSLLLAAAGNVPSGIGILSSDLVLTNTTDSPITAVATLLDHEGSSAAPSPATRTLEAHQSLRWTDPLGALFGMSGGYGAIAWATADGSASLVATVRLSAASGSLGGTVAQQIESRGAADARTWGSLLGLKQDASFGAGVIFLNQGTSVLTITLELREPSGVLLGSRTLDIPSSRFVQKSLPELFPDATFPSGTALTLSFRSPGPVFALGSLVDKRTGDPSLFASAP